MVLICNPVAGRGKAGKALPEVRRHLEARELDHDIWFTKRKGHATELTREALTSGCRFVVAVGGDGTINEVVNGLLHDDRPVNPNAVMGVIPAGTGADFIRTFGIPSMPGHAVAHLDGGDAFPIDIGKVIYTDSGSSITRTLPMFPRSAWEQRWWLGPQVAAVARPHALRRSFLAGPAKHKTADVSVDSWTASTTGP